MKTSYALLNFLLLLASVLAKSLNISEDAPAVNLSERTNEDVTKADGGCSISINGGLPKYDPLILLTGETPTIALPNRNGILEVATEGRLRLACTGYANNITVTETREAVVTCVSGTLFRVETPAGSEVVEFKNLSCSQYPYSIARYRTDEDPDCHHPYSAVEIGFVLPDDNYFLRVIDGCFDGRSLNALYTRFDMPYSISAAQKGVPRRNYAKGRFYGKVPVSWLYSRKKQTTTITEILGSDQLGLKYVNSTALGYLSRGHLSAKGDFIYGSLQRATFYFINAAPQWNSFNAGNWAALEGSLRDFASQSLVNLTVWTGTHGITALPDVNGTKHGISLYLDENGNQQIDVPAVYWKVVLDKRSSRAAAFVGVNNPYLDQVPENLIYCESVCDEISWLKWRPESLTKGFSYCCEVEELRKTINTIPKFEISGLLT